MASDAGSEILMTDAEDKVRDFVTRNPISNYWPGDIQYYVGPLYRELRFDEAVREAGFRLENRVAMLSGADAGITGTKLAAHALEPNSGKLSPLNLPGAEQVGLKNLFLGAIEWMRNPVSHRMVGNSPLEALGAIGVISYVMSTIDSMFMQRCITPCFPKNLNIITLLAAS